jgi:pyruvate,water dikinase
VITDIGAPTGHLATITRELRVPSIMDAEIATAVLTEGMEVTVDAEENIVYEGRVGELLLYQLVQQSLYLNTREFRLLRRILRYTTPLNLKNPASKNFSAKRCETYHDIVRFAHEMAVEYLVSGQALDLGKSSPYCRKVVMDVPLDLTVIDLGGGAVSESSGAACGIDEITCAPLSSLLEGINAPGAWSSEPAGMDFESFMSSATGPSILATPQARVPARNLAIVSEHHINVNLYLGYHFNQVDAYVSEARNDNYLYFRFSGGMTNITRRSRRARMISIILERHDFAVDTLGDFIVARLKKFDQETMLERLKMVGYLIGFTRQMDVRMTSDAMIEEGIERFMETIYSVFSI